MNIPLQRIKSALYVFAWIFIVIIGWKVRMLNQYFIIGKTQIHLIYNENGNQTKVIANRTQKNEEGLLIVAIRTDKGKFYYQIRNMR